MWGCRGLYQGATLNSICRSLTREGHDGALIKSCYVMPMLAKFIQGIPEGQSGMDMQDMMVYPIYQQIESFRKKIRTKGIWSIQRMEQHYLQHGGNLPKEMIKHMQGVEYNFVKMLSMWDNTILMTVPDPKIQWMYQEACTVLEVANRQGPYDANNGLHHMV